MLAIPTSCTDQPEHAVRSQRPSTHLNGGRCGLCGQQLGHIGVAGLVAHQAAQFALGRPQLCYRLLQSALLLLQAPSLGSLHPAARMVAVRGLPGLS